METALLSLIKVNKLTLSWLCVAFALFMSPISAGAAAQEGFKHQLTLPEVVQQIMSMHFGEKPLGSQSLESFINSLHSKQQFQKRAGIFVTLSRQGKTRACWGSIYPQYENLVKSTAYATIGALTKEYRYPPVRATEWKKLHAQVTVIKGVEPISSISFQNPLRDGLMVRSGGKSGVLLPGEALDAHYQLVLCKLKAGIKSGEPCQLYRLRTEIYE